MYVLLQLLFCSRHLQKKHPTHTLHFSFSFFSFSKILKVPESPHRNKMFDASTNGHKRTALGSVDPNTPGDRERYVSFSFRPLQFFLLSLFLFRQHDKSIDLECVCVRFQTSFCLLTSFAPSTNFLDGLLLATLCSRKKKKRKSMGRRVSFAPGKQLDEIREYQKNATEWNDAPATQKEENPEKERAASSLAIDQAQTSISDPKPHQA